MIVAKVFFKDVWRAYCECGWHKTSCYVENAYEELSKHIVKEHRTLDFKIVVLTNEEI